MKKLFEKGCTFLVDRFTGRNAKKFEAHDEIMTFPNMVTICGILWTFLYIVMYAFEICTYLIPVLVVLIVLTDMIDGWLADRFNQHSKYGKILDPVRDRIFTLALLGNILVIVGIVTLLPIVFLVMSELYLTLYYREEYRKTGKVPDVHWIGKARSALQWLLGFTIIVQYYWLGMIYISPMLLIMIMALASMFAFFHYVAFRMK